MWTELSDNTFNFKCQPPTSLHIQAARYLANQVTTWPALRPLSLVAKAYLKSQGLNDVSTGGLSSYGLTYMVGQKCGVGDGMWVWEVWK